MTTLLLVDDQTLFREGLVALLNAQADLEIVAVAADGRAALELARRHRPGVVLMDIAMPGLNGIDTTARLKRVAPESRVIGLSMHADPALVRQMLEAGAAGYVQKDAGYQALIEAIREVGAGGRYLSDGLAADQGEAPAIPPLTAREREVLHLLAEGHGSGRIAEMLHISVKTVESHRERIRAKLGIDNTAGLIKYAIREGLSAL